MENENLLGLRMDNENNYVHGMTTSLLFLVYIVGIAGTVILARWATYYRPVQVTKTDVLAILCVLIIMSIVIMVVSYCFRTNRRFFLLAPRSTVRRGLSNLHLPTLGIHLFGIGSIVLDVVKVVNHIMCFQYDKRVSDLVFHIAKCIFIFIQMQFLRKLRGARCNNSKFRWLLLILLATNISVWLHVLIQETQEIFTGSKGVSAKANYSPDFGQECIQKNTSLGIYINGNMNPYLYPFLMEYSFLAAAEICLLWMVRHENENENENENVNIHIQDRHVHRNQECKYLIYIGMLLTVILIIVESLMHIDEVKDSLIDLFYITRLVYSIMLLISAVAGFFTVRCVPLRHTNFTMNDTMMILSVAGQNLYLLFGVVACIGTLAKQEQTNLPDTTLPKTELATNLVKLVEVFIQTRLLIRGAKFDFDNRNETYSRFQEILGYLAICNLGDWVAYSFIEGKLLHSDLVNPTPYFYYGDRGWMLIGKITYPFYIFYRLHAFVMCWEIVFTH